MQREKIGYPAALIGGINLKIDIMVTEEKLEALTCKADLYF